MSNSLQNALSEVEALRSQALKGLSPHHRSQMGQFFTPMAVAKFMSSMVEAPSPSVRILDAGAGIGMLFASCVCELCGRAKRPGTIEVTAYEAEPRFIDYLNRALELCHDLCRAFDVAFTGKVIPGDFIKQLVPSLNDDLFAPQGERYSLAILNPPYKKIPCKSETRALLNLANLETTNLYSAFVWLSAMVLEDGGELVAITPRSFCNGPYFRSFRKSFLNMMRLDKLHIFESRDRIFLEDDVLQENVIFHAVKGLGSPETVAISTSNDPESSVETREVDYNRIVYPHDRDFFIHIPTASLSVDIAHKMAVLPATIGDLGLTVSTGRVVDFRAKEYLSEDPKQNTSPLIYPTHFSKGYIEWPKIKGKKPNALKITPETLPLLIPSGYYVLARRFSAKEEKRRIVAAIHDPLRVPANQVGFENHLNYFHAEGQSLNPQLAKGLALYLNSTFVDCYFRQFNGHTQVNATDLRKIRYPSMDGLLRLGSRLNNTFPAQEEIDILVERELFNHGQEKASGKVDQAKNRRDD